MLPWIFLTIAIMLGGWWAYEVLGWGGYWAWDPVENASFLPWLTATAALHSVMLVERRGILKGWTVTLVLATFLLTILGTFMTRSGVFNSVHSFTQSAIGPTILVFLAAALLFSVALLASASTGSRPRAARASRRSREAMFLVNNLLFVLFTFTVLIGTVFPLIVEALSGKQMSVGRPYFDRMAVPHRRGAAASSWASARRCPGAAPPPSRCEGAAAAARAAPRSSPRVGFALGVRNGWTLVTLAFGGYTAQVTLREMFLPMRAAHARARRGASAGASSRRSCAAAGAASAAYVVHAGAVVIVIVAIAVSSTMGSPSEVQLREGRDGRRSAGYTLTFLGAEQVSEPHREALVARVAVGRGRPRAWAR